MTDNMKAEIKPLRKTLTIIEVSGKSLEGLGIVKMFLEADVLGGRKLAEASVTEEEGSKETLISLDLLKKWDLIDAYKMTNKCYQAYSSLYDFQTDIYN